MLIGPHWLHLSLGLDALLTLGVTVSIFRATMGQAPPTFTPWNTPQGAQLLLVPAVGMLLAASSNRNTGKIVM